MLQKMMAWLVIIIVMWRELTRRKHWYLSDAVDRAFMSRFLWPCKKSIDLNDPWAGDLVEKGFGPSPPFFLELLTFDAAS